MKFFPLLEERARERCRYSVYLAILRLKPQNDGHFPLHWRGWHVVTGEGFVRYKLTPLSNSLPRREDMSICRPQGVGELILMTRSLAHLIIKLSLLHNLNTLLVFKIYPCYI